MEDSYPPLFMTELPKDFTKNVALSALGSLLEEEEEHDNEDGNNETGTRTPELQSDLSTNMESEQRDFSSPMEVESIHMTNFGGGKASRTKVRDRGLLSKNAPYPKSKTTPKPKKPPTGKSKGGKAIPSVGESTLYLKLWKL